MTTAPYVAVATLLDRVHTWWDSKREEWALTRLLVDEVEAGWVPEPAMVGLVDAPDVEVLAMPSEVVEAKPADIHDCGRCDGQGMYVSYEGDDGRLAGYRFCSWCPSTGRVGAA